MKPSQIISAVSALIDSNTPSFLWGPSGIGKSSIIKHIALAKDMQFFELSVSFMDLTDVEAISSSLPKEGQGILYLDELDSVSATALVCAYELISNRKLGEYKLPDGWAIVAAGSIETEEMHKMSIPLLNRVVHLELDVDINDWKDWAFNYGIDERIIAYIAYQKEDLFAFDPNLGEKSFATPRSWELVSSILRSGMDENLLLDVIAGAIGKDKAISFLSFAKATEKLPDIESILQKAEADYPIEADVLYMLSSVLVSFLLKYSNEENLENVLKYSLELEPEFAVMIVQDLQRSGLSMEHLESFPAWVGKFAKIRSKHCKI